MYMYMYIYSHTYIYIYIICGFVKNRVPENPMVDNNSNGWLGAHLILRQTLWPRMA